MRIGEKRPGGMMATSASVGIRSSAETGTKIRTIGGPGLGDTQQALTRGGILIEKCAGVFGEDDSVDRGGEDE